MSWSEEQDLLGVFHDPFWEEMVDIIVEGLRVRLAGYQFNHKLAK